MPASSTESRTPDSGPAAPAVRIGEAVVLDGRAPVFLLGPCVIESEAFLMAAAERLAGIAEACGIRFVFKASYDKANRTSVGSFRGPGCLEGSRLLGEVRRRFGVPVVTDIHLPEEAAIAAEHVDLLQIPAFLCRQTDLLAAAAATGLPVAVKKGQFLAPWDVAPIAEKLTHFGARSFFFIERGSSFGYNNLVADMRSLAWIREQGFRVVFDATHSVQRPGGLGGATGGDGALAPVLARAAVAAGCDGIFMETHPDPPNALSDGPNQVPLDAIESHLRTLVRIHESLDASP